MKITAIETIQLRAYPNLIAHHARIADRDAVREVHRIEGNL